MIYLDHAATTFPKSERVYRKMDEINRELSVNAGRGSYTLAEKAQERIGSARSEVSNLFFADQRYLCVFTPSATFAMNTILFGREWKKGELVDVSPYEHNSVMRPLEELKRRYGIRLREMPLDEELRIDTEKWDYECSKECPAFVAVTAVSNVTGYCLPLEKILEIAKEYQAEVLIDASQAAGLIPLNLSRLPVDYLVFAGHKTLYGPLGIGGFLADSKKLEKLKPYLFGGTGSDSLNLLMEGRLPGRFEAGSPNLVAIGGLYEALLELKEQGKRLREKEWNQKNEQTGRNGFAGRKQPNPFFEEWLDYEAGMRKLLKKERELFTKFREGLFSMNRINVLPKKAAAEEYTGIVSFTVDGYDAEDVGEILNEEFDIAVRTGYHCAPWIHKHLGSLETKGCVRVSFGRTSSMDEVRYVLEALEDL